MKRTISIILLLFLAESFAFSQCNKSLVTSCCTNISSDAIFLQQYRAKLRAADVDSNLPVARFSVLLSKGNTYTLNVCSALDYEGEGILQLYDGSVKVASTYDLASKTNFKGFQFTCTKTAIYKVYISFLDGKRGCAVGILSMKK